MWVILEAKITIVFFILVSDHWKISSLWRAFHFACWDLPGLDEPKASPKTEKNKIWKVENGKADSVVLKSWNKTSQLGQAPRNRWGTEACASPKFGQIKIGFLKYEILRLNKIIWCLTQIKTVPRSLHNNTFFTYEIQCNGHSCVDYSNPF